METIVSNKVKMVFFPYIAAGHLLPLIDMARFLASCHPNAQVTIITTPQTVQLFQTSITHDREGGHDITFHTLDLPVEVETENFLGQVSSGERTKVVAAFMRLRAPLLELLRACRPDCLVSDMLHFWTLDVAREVDVPWIVFHSSNLIALAAEDCLARLKPHQTVGSDTEPFELIGLPHKVQFTRLQLPDWFRSGDQNDELLPINRIRKLTVKSYGVIVNSCEDLEGEFHSYFENAVGAKTWMVGPVNVCSNRNIDDIRVEGEETKRILKWLDSKEQHSVLYISFGSEAQFCKEQFHELGHGLEASGRPFIWVARPNVYRDQGEEGWFPDGFEEQMRESNQGLIIKGWAPQLQILAHANVGAFLTHCGTNSYLESLSKGVPMLTWPLSHEQFYGESLVVDVLKVGIRVGNGEWMATGTPPKVTVTRDQVEVAVRYMASREELAQMRERAQQYALKCKKTVQNGGSSYSSAHALVEDLKARKNILG